MENVVLNDSEFAVLDSYSFDVSFFDDLSYDNGNAIVADHYNDCVLIFDVNENAKMPLTLRGGEIRVPNATWRFPLERPGSHGCDELW